MKWKRLRRLGRVIVFLFVGLFVVGVAGETAVSVQAIAPGQGIDRIQSLIDQAEESGTVRVIVQLDVPFQPQGRQEGNDQAVQAQRQAIDAAQGHVLEEITAANLVAEFEYIPYLALEVDTAALSELAALPQVLSIAEDVPVPASLSSSTAVIGADDAWAAGYTGAGQTVVILDTGVDTDHPAFGGRVVSEACYSTTNASYGSYTVCPGGVEESTAAGSGVDCTAAVAGYANATSGCEHGTHVAGIAAGSSGVAPGADIIAIQVFSLFTNSAYCGGYSDCVLTWTSDQILGLERVYELSTTYDVAAVNMSLGGGDYADVCDGDGRKAAIDNLRAAGVATVIASGNNGSRDSMSAPACISSAVSVGATDDYDNVASFSNIAPFLDLLAPGVSIVAPVPGGGTGTKSGTSMATPHVTGAWALYKQAMPGAIVDEAITALQNSGTLVDDNRIGGVETDMPRLNIDAAINQVVTGLTVEVAASSFVLPQDSLDYTVTVTNETGTASGEVVITDAVPQDVTLVAGSLSGDAVTTGTDPGSVITWNTGQSLAPGESLSRSFSVTVAADPAADTITNTATATGADMDEARSGTAVSTIITVVSCGFSDGFEAGTLGTAWQTAVTNDGRVRVLSDLPHSGSYSAVMDDAVPGDTYSQAGLILTADLNGQSDVTLTFNWFDLGDEYSAAYDGVFVRETPSDSWVKIYDFSGDFTEAYQAAAVDLDTAVADAGLNYSDRFQIKFAFEDNFSFVPSNIGGGDGYAIDDVQLGCVETATVDPQATAPQTVSLGNGALELLIPVGALPDNAAAIRFRPRTEPSTAMPAMATDFLFDLELLDGNGDPIPEPTFAKPLQATVRYHENQIPDGLNVEQLLLYTYSVSAGGWQATSVLARDLENQTITVALTHFSEFGLGGPLQVFIPLVLR